MLYRSGCAWYFSYVARFLGLIKTPTAFLLRARAGGKGLASEAGGGDEGGDDLAVGLCVDVDTDDAVEAGLLAAAVDGVGFLMTRGWPNFWAILPLSPVGRGPSVLGKATGLALTGALMGSSSRI